MTTNVEVTISNSDMKIFIPFGTFSSTRAGVSRNGSCVSYRLEPRDPITREWVMTFRDQSSTADTPLINHGKDGVELAVRWSDLNRTRGQKFGLAVVDFGFPESHEHVIPINVSR